MSDGKCDRVRRSVIKHTRHHNVVRYHQNSICILYNGARCLTCPPRSRRLRAAPRSPRQRPRAAPPSATCGGGDGGGGARVLVATAARSDTDRECFACHTRARRDGAAHRERRERARAQTRRDPTTHGSGARRVVLEVVGGHPRPARCEWPPPGMHKPAIPRCEWPSPGANPPSPGVSGHPQVRAARPQVSGGHPQV